MYALLLFVLLSLGQAQQPADAAKQSPRLLEALKVLGSGKVDEAVAALRTVVAAEPQSFDAHLALGRALDMQGNHAEARKELEHAVTLATDQNRNQALAALAISWAFESKPDESARYYQRVVDAEMQNNRAGAAGAANALGRIYLESGNLDKAEQWYRTGYETSKQQPDQTTEQLALWEMRWHNAQGRIAARRKNAAAANKHAQEAKMFLEKSKNENQRIFQPYLTGYIAFYTGDYKRAVDDLLQSDQSDPFILGLIAQAYDKLGDKAKAREYFEKVLALPGHSINAAFSWPQARRYLRRR